MKQLLTRLWREQDGVLSFEWTMLTSLLTVGVVSGIAAVRDATIDELGDVAQAMISLDQSYQVEPPLVARVHTVGAAGWGYSGGWGWSSASGSAFVDAASYADCYRGHTRVQEFPGASRPGTDAPPQTDPAL